MRCSPPRDATRAIPVRIQTRRAGPGLGPRIDTARSTASVEQRRRGEIYPGFAVPLPPRPGMRVAAEQESDISKKPRKSAGFSGVAKPAGCATTCATSVQRLQCRFPVPLLLRPRVRIGRTAVVAHLHTEDRRYVGAKSGSQGGWGARLGATGTSLETPPRRPPNSFSGGCADQGSSDWPDWLCG